ncbi:MAG: YraN family protein [Miltoncostaeaceae bacterium]
MNPSAALTGRRGEDAAARHLARRGWRVLARNWRGGGGEIDLVARRAAVLAMCEVKTRSGAGRIPERVTARQRERIRRAAECYLAATATEREVIVRLDLLLVSARRPFPGWAVEHLPGALE